MTYTIVEYAQDGEWEFVFDSDPKLGVDIYHSIYGTYIANSNGMTKKEYDSIEELRPILNACVEADPCGSYAICPIITKG